MIRPRHPFIIIGLVLGACGDGGGRPQPTVCSTTSGMGMLVDHDVPCDPGGAGVLLVASGEPFAIDGYRFPPVTDQEVSMVDGWDITYERVLTTFDHVTLSNAPDASPTDQSITGTVVAEVDGPFAIDLHAGGPLLGKDGEPVPAVAAWTGQNAVRNAAFDPSVRYAFGFDVVAATRQAQNINLDAAALADYQEMIAKGYTTLLVGTATWKGNNNGSLTDSGCTSTIAGYDFSKLPTTMKFRFGFKAPASYINAQNPDNDPASPFGGEEHQRGIAIVANRSTIAQLTFHLDHSYWESFEHDSPAHFDEYAALHAGETGTPTVTLEDGAGVSFTPFVDKLGQQLPWRECTGGAAPTLGAMTFDTKGVPVNAAGDPAMVIRDFADYATYNHSTFGHLNADGLAFVERHYPSPK